MEKINVNGKQFRLYMTEQEIQECVKRVARQISDDYRGKAPVLCPVLTGSIMFISDLSRYLDFDPALSFVRYKSYSGTHSTGQVQRLLSFPEFCRGKDVIIVEDIVDSGITMEVMLEELRRMEPASIRICTLFFKPDNFVKEFPIDYIGKSIANDFIVGYGLDFDEKGRTYRDLYILDED